MRFPTAILLGLLITSAAEAQTSQIADPPKGQTLLNGLMGKNQPQASGKTTSKETKEQHDHYVKKDPYTQPITSSSVRNNIDD
ncbi:MAG: hypothetical protein ACRYG8_04770 [Janthinobacterium lividum]